MDLPCRFRRAAGRELTSPDIPVSPVGEPISATGTAADAQDYPSKPLRFILPYAPGGIIDYVGRTLAHRLSENMGQPVVAENRPGAGGIAGTDFVAKAPSDGYTLLLMDPAVVINPTLQPSIPYNLFKELKTVSVISSS